MHNSHFIENLILFSQIPAVSLACLTFSRITKLSTFLPAASSCFVLNLDCFYLLDVCMQKQVKNICGSCKHETQFKFVPYEIF